MSPKLKCYKKKFDFFSTLSGQSEFGTDCLGLVFFYLCTKNTNFLKINLYPQTKSDVPKLNNDTKLLLKRICSTTLFSRTTTFNPGKPVLAASCFMPVQRRPGPIVRFAGDSHRLLQCYWSSGSGVYSPCILWRTVFGIKGILKLKTNFTINN